MMQRYEIGSVSAVTGMAHLEEDDIGDYVLYSDAHALEVRNQELVAALTEIVGCFNAASFEGLAEQIGDYAVEDGSIIDLVRRRLLPAGDAARKALAQTEGGEAPKSP